MFGGGSAHHNSSLLNTLMISSNFPLFTTPPLSNASFSAPQQSAQPLFVTPPPSYAEAILNAVHQRQFAKVNALSCANKPSISLTAIPSPDILRLAAKTTAVSLNDLDEEEDGTRRKQNNNSQCVDADEVKIVININIS